MWPIYRYPYDLISQTAKNQEWSGREDLNLRPPGPEPVTQGRYPAWSSTRLINNLDGHFQQQDYRTRGSIRLLNRNSECECEHTSLVG